MATRSSGGANGTVVPPHRLALLLLLLLPGGAAGGGSALLRVPPGAPEEPPRSRRAAQRPPEPIQVYGQVSRGRDLPLFSPSPPTPSPPCIIPNLFILNSIKQPHGRAVRYITHAALPPLPPASTACVSPPISPPTMCISRVNAALRGSPPPPFLGTAAPC